MPKSAKLVQKLLKKSKNCWSYSQSPALTKKRGIYLQNPTAGLQTYWALGAQVPQEFAAKFKCSTFMRRVKDG